MKIIHTSDWHLGHMLYNFDRREEQLSMLEQMAELVRAEQPDLFLLAGDVYDSTQPSASVQTLFADALIKIHEACPDMRIVCIAGNHDSSSKFMIFHSPWERMNVSMLGTVSRDVDFSDYIFKMEGKGYVVAVPYAAERNTPEDFFRKLSEKVDELNREEQLPVVLMAHLAVTGSDFRGHDNATDAMVGGVDCQSAEVFGNGYDYIALGHIHRAQFVNGTAYRARYCGTPIPVSFDEAMGAQEHGVTIVEIGRHGDAPEARAVAIENPRPLVTLPLDGFAEWDEVKKQFEEYPDDIPAYIRLNVLVDSHLSVTANAEAQQIAARKQCRFCLINAQRKTQTIQSAGFQPLTTTEFQRMNPMDVARMFLESKGEDVDDGLLKLFNEVIKGINDED
ncbi:MAG: exonuclease SbcCD subunit D [Bacteroidales bacterium]|nr:exonuclease SbcCD subunit D [Bacteroidales bacterium]